MAENEYRVRAVERFVVTHYHSDGPKASCDNLGEFPSQRAAERVALALHQLDAPSTFVTIEGEKSWAMPRIGVGSKIEIEGATAEVWGVHEWKDRRLLDVIFPGGEYCGCSVQETSTGYVVMRPATIAVNQDIAAD